MGANKKKIRESLTTITRKWWFYILISLPIYTPIYTAKGYEVQQSIDVVMNALTDPIIYGIPILFPITKVIIVIFIASIIIAGNKVRRVFNIYIALLFLTIAVLQNASQTEKYGLVVITGNLIMVMWVALAWIWEVFTEQNDYTPHKKPFWKWWVMPLAALALLAPFNPETFTTYFRLSRLLTSESGLTNCMMTPVVLAVLTLYYPTINRPLLRIMSYVGIYFGLVNMVVWFLIMPSGWWMGVLHIPMLTISVYAFILGIGKAK
jgi:hypothetical protein